MIRISLPWVVALTEAIDRLEAVESDKFRVDFLLEYYGVTEILKSLYQTPYGPYMKVSLQAHSSLMSAIEVASDLNNDEKISIGEASSIKYLGKQFKDLLLAELNIVPSYLVAEKGVYDVNYLIHQGARLFPSTILAKCPEAAQDMEEVGKALAFELATSCGFHTFRVVEAVVKRYWSCISGGKEQPRPSGIGRYAAELRQQNLGDAKVWESLKQLANLHRNPIIHPEVHLTVEEAIDILGIARSAISTMLRVMPETSPTTVHQDSET